MRTRRALAVAPRALCLALVALGLGALVVGSAAAAERARSIAPEAFGPDGTEATVFESRLAEVGSIYSLDFNPASDQLVVSADSPLTVHTFQIGTPLASDWHAPVGQFETEAEGNPFSYSGQIAVDPVTSNVYVTGEGLEGDVGGYAADGTVLPNFPAPFGSAAGISVNSEGEVFVGEIWEEAIEVIDAAAGHLASFPGAVNLLRVDPTTGDLYAAEEGGFGRVYRLKKEDDYSFSSAVLMDPERPEEGNYYIGPTDMGVDPTTGDLFVTQNYADDILIFNREGQLLERIQMPVHPHGITVGSDGTAYVGVKNQILEIANALMPEAETGNAPTDSELSGTADPAGASEIVECFFQWGESANYKFNTEKAPCAQAVPITSPEEVNASLPPLTVGNAYHYRLVLRNAERATAYGPDRVLAPGYVKDLRTQPATEITRQTAKLNASFTGDGTETTYYFEWGKDFGYGNTMPATPMSAGSPDGHTDISVDISGLKPQTTYHYRVVATNAEGTSEAQDRSFETLPAVADVRTKPASAISLESITLNGEFEGNGEDTRYYFEWGTTSGYGQATPSSPADAGNGSGPVQVSAPFTEFEGTATYHYRLVASNALGTSYGQDETVSTVDPIAPTVAGTWSESVDQDSARLLADVNPHRWATIYLFEYGPSASYGSTTEAPGPLAGNSNLSRPVSLEVGELEPATVYHFRVIATNFIGSTVGPDETFRTAGVPGVDAATASGITSTSAQLSAVVLPNLRDTSVHFQYGPTAGYGLRTPESASVGSDAAPHTVGAKLSGLAPSTTYHFRAVATNAIGTTQTSEGVFTTAAASEGSTPGHKGCKRGYVKRHGRCVRKHQGHRKRHHRRHRHHHRSTHRHG